MSWVFFYKIASEEGQSNGDTQKSSTELAFVCLARSCKTGVISKAFPWQPQLLQCSLPQMKFAWAGTITCRKWLEQSYKVCVCFQVLFFTYFRQISVKAYSLQGRSNDPSLFVASSFGSVRRQTARPFTMHSRTALRSMRASAARSLRSWRPISVDAMQLNAPLKELVGSCCGWGVRCWATQVRVLSSIKMQILKLRGLSM